jgi:hypothetical protein
MYVPTIQIGLQRSAANMDELAARCNGMNPTLPITSVLLVRDLILPARRDRARLDGRRPIKSDADI